MISGRGELMKNYQAKNYEDLAKYQRTMNMKPENDKKQNKSLRNGFIKKGMTKAQKDAIRDSGYRKAAEFLILLGKEEAAKVLKHMTEEEVKGITREIALIKSIDEREAKKILEEFGYLATTKDLIARGGLEKAKEILVKAFGEEKGNAIFKKIEMKTVPHPFSFLMDLDFEQVKMLLKDESVPVISVILPHLDPRLASKILSTFEMEKQKEIIRRISRMEKIDPEVLRRTEEALKKKILTQGEIVTEELNGKESLAEILKYMDYNEGKKILSELQSEDPEVAREIEKKLFTIDVINNMSDRDLQRILRDYNERELALIIKGSDESVRERILSNVSSRMREIIEEEIEVMGPVKRVDIEKTIEDFLNYIKLEEARGAITIIHERDEIVN